MHTAPDRLFVTVQSRLELDAALEDAVEALKPPAITEQVGISVTRLALGRYEVRLNREVPPGLTIERWGNESYT